MLFYIRKIFNVEGWKYEIELMQFNEKKRQLVQIKTFWKQSGQFVLSYICKIFNVEGWKYQILKNWITIIGIFSWESRTSYI